jgi:hypothetical protein
MSLSPEEAWTQVEKAWLEVEGYPAFLAWFERTPTFHDATIESFSADIDRGVELTLRAFRMLPEVDDRGFFMLDKHCRVRIALSGVTDCYLDFDDTDRIAYSVEVHHIDGGLQMEIEGISGLEAKISARRIALEFEPIEATAKSESD